MRFFTFALLFLWSCQPQLVRAQTVTLPSFDPVAVVPWQDQCFVFDRSGIVCCVDAVSGTLKQSKVMTSPIADASIIIRAVDNRPLPVCVVINTKEQTIVAFDPQGDESHIAAMRLDFVPHRLAIINSGNLSHLICVVGYWSQRMQLLTWNNGQFQTLGDLQKLPFVPGGITSVGDEGFAISGAFGAEVAWLAGDQQGLSQPVVHTLIGHHIGGMAVDPTTKRLYVSHQRLSKNARTTFDDIHWGNLMQNLVSVFPFDSFCDSKARVLRPLKAYTLGDVGDGFSDPMGIVPWREGFAVVSSGTDQLLVHDGKQVKQKIALPRVPAALAATDNGRLIATCRGAGAMIGIEANGTDSLAIAWQVKSERHPMSEGEQLFRDARLAHDGWMSCSSCHVDGHTCDLLADTKGDGTYGAAKKIPSLFGVASTAPYGWLGNKVDLATQLHSTMETTMRPDEPSPEVIEPIVAYLQQLALPTEWTALEPHSEANNVEFQRGKVVFEQRGCVHCHAPPEKTTANVYDVGLVDELGHREFNPPSLRGVGYRRRLMHDGRATSVREVLQGLKHQVPKELSEADVQALLRYLTSA